MFLVSKLITAVILPPGSIIAAMMIIALVYFRKLLKGSKIFLIIYLLLMTSLYILSTEYFSEKLIKPLEEFSYSYNDFGASESNTPEMIVVLGGGSIIHTMNDGSPVSEISSTTKNRLLEGMMVQRETGVPLLFTGGNVLKGVGAPGEADAVREIFVRMGLAKEAYLLEDKSRNTFENAFYTSKLTNLRKITLITSAYHGKRSSLCFQKAGFDVLEIRAVDSRIDEKEFTILDLIPSMGAFRTSSTALHEYFGLLYYRILYGI